MQQDQANQLRDLVQAKAKQPEPQPVDPPPMPAIRSAEETTTVRFDRGRGCRTIAVTSGKGGVGKTNIAVNIAIGLQQQGAKVCILDANLGLANVNLLCGLGCYWNLSHVVTGARRHLGEIMIDGPEGIHVIPGASGIKDVADCPPNVQAEIISQMQGLEREHDFIVVDTGTGIHRTVRNFLLNCDTILLVTTAEPTSIADAYATIKSLPVNEDAEILALVNQADSVRQAHAIVERLQQTARLFVKQQVISAGYIPRDPEVPRAVVARAPFLVGAPDSPASASIRQLCRLLHKTSKPRAGFFERIFQPITSKRAA